MTVFRTRIERIQMVEYSGEQGISSAIRILKLLESRVGRHICPQQCKIKIRIAGISRFLLTTHAFCATIHCNAPDAVRA